MADSKLDREFLRTVLSLAAKAEVDRLLLVSDVPLSAEHLRGRPLKKKLVYAVSEDRLAQTLRRQGYVCVTVPPYDYSRVEKVKVALVAAMTANVLADGENVLCLTGRSGARMPDTLIRLQIGRGFEEKAAIDTIGLGAEFNPQVVEALVSLAMAIGHEGFGFPGGGGPRHAAAAAIRVETHAISISVSQSSGTVRVFKNGDPVLELQQVARRS